ncbi:unnamed protein product [Caenorhabditis angaria]|uniref:Calpain catalytic domain-containing protein n=1 Tax=Caenorhabditis angaria TaxID=860376 RepID=A0A9P1MX75_9PELO|nr:unnamed protein product [Caenorhabditis angaria]
MLRNLCSNSCLRFHSEETLKLKKEVEEKNEKIYQDILNYCNENQTSFIDDQFPHSDRSIRRNGEYEWLRPNQIRSKDGEQYPWTVFNNPKPSDIEQGGLGDCWLMCAMTLIAERPDLLDSIFPSKDYSPQGVYRVKVCVEGEWKVIIVDDFFPCCNGKMTMAVGRRNQLWVPLIEKALAKALGSYSMLCGASVIRGLSLLTGAPCILYYTPKDDSIEVETFWAELISAKASGFIMCCSSYRTLREEYHKSGLRSGHAYSILDVNDEYGFRLLRVRNPWGRGVWNGNWSDNWEDWPAEMKDDLVMNRQHETGAFWMELEDFRNMFKSVTICKLRSNWSEFRYSQNVGLDTSIYQLFVTQTTEVCITAYHKESSEMNNDPYNEMMMSVHRISAEGVIGEMMTRSTRGEQKRITFYDFFLHPGQYVVMCFNLKNGNLKPITMNIVFYSSEKLLFEKIRQSSQMYNHALREIMLKDGKICNNTCSGLAIRVLIENFCGAMIMADNFSEDRWNHVKIDCNGSKNLESSRNSLLTTDVIPPMSYSILNVLSRINGSSNHRYVYKWERLNTSCKYIKPEMNDEASNNPQLQHWPVIDDSDPLHSSQPLIYGT